MKVRKKPLLFDAMLWDGKITEELVVFMGYEPKLLEGKLEVRTLEGTVYVSPNMWILKGIENEIWPVKKEIFEKTYDEVFASYPPTNACASCSNSPFNGGSGICNCTLGDMAVTSGLSYQEKDIKPIDYETTTTCDGCNACTMDEYAKGNI